VANTLSCLELELNPPLDARADHAAEIFAITSDDFSLAAHPLNFKGIVALQQQDKELLDSAVSNKDYHLKSFSGGIKVQKVICYKGKIVCLQLLQEQAVCWYHAYLCHPGKFAQYSRL